jgi:ribose 5-phosphate isomerase RpiB
MTRERLFFRIAIGSDHTGRGLNQAIKEHLRDLKQDVLGLGTHCSRPPWRLGSVLCYEAAFP